MTALNQSATEPVDGVSVVSGAAGSSPARIKKGLFTCLNPSITSCNSLPVKSSILSHSGKTINGVTKAAISAKRGPNRVLTSILSRSVNPDNNCRMSLTRNSCTVITRFSSRFIVLLLRILISTVGAALAAMSAAKAAPTAQFLE